MARFTIKSRDHGDVEFVCADDHGYVRVYIDDHRGNAKQICEGGSFMGSTIMADATRLEAKSRKWWGQFLRRERANNWADMSA